MEHGNDGKEHPDMNSSSEKWNFTLYVAGDNLSARRAKKNLQGICDEYLEGRYAIEIVDLVEHPEIAEEDQILAAPTLVRKLPLPLRRIIGDLSSREKVLIGLEIES